MQYFMPLGAIVCSFLSGVLGSIVDVKSGIELLEDLSGVDVQ